MRAGRGRSVSMWVCSDTAGNAHCTKLHQLNHLDLHARRAPEAETCNDASGVNVGGGGGKMDRILISSHPTCHSITQSKPNIVNDAWVDRPAVSCLGRFRSASKLP